MLRKRNLSVSVCGNERYLLQVIAPAYKGGVVWFGQEEGDIISATVAAALKKAAVYILGDEKSQRGQACDCRLLSAAVGLLAFLLCAPAVSAFSSLEEVRRGSSNALRLPHCADDFLQFS